MLMERKSKGRDRLNGIMIRNYGVNDKLLEVFRGVFLFMEVKVRVI